MSTMTNKRILINGRGIGKRKMVMKRDGVRSRNEWGRNESNFTNTVYYNI